MADNFQVIGRRLPRLDARIKACGEAKYTADIQLAGMLVGAVVHSPYPHARIRGIDVTRAGRVKGVRSIITGQDTIKAKFGPMGPDEEGLAVDKVRYIGEPVAAIAAVDEDSLWEAMEAIAVDYEVLPPVFTPEQALAEGAPVLHEATPNNLSARIGREWGDIAKGFAQSDLIMENTFHTKPQVHCSLEPHAAVADYKDGTLILWSTTQGPFSLRIDLSQALGLPESRIRVIKPPVGGGFGGKRELTGTDFAASVIAMRTGRPVRMVYDREEEFYATRQRHAVEIKLKLGMAKDGRLLAKDCFCMFDGGAYRTNGPGVVAAAARVLMTVFPSPHGKFLGLRPYTNNPVSSAFRGFGGLQVRFAEESLMDMMCRKLGLDPVAVRLLNAVRVGQLLPNGFTPISCGLDECIRQASQLANYSFMDNKLPQNQGIGFACEDYISSARSYAPPDCSGAVVEMNLDGTVKLFTGSADIGQGSETTLAQIAAEVLGVTLDKIKITAADTMLTPVDEMGTYASRVTFVAGNAVKDAAEKARDQLACFQAEKWECAPGDLIFKNNKISHIENAKEIPLAEALNAYLYQKRRHVMALGDYDPGTVRPDFVTGQGYYSPTYSYGAQGATVQLDPETGRVKVTQVVSVEDCGRAINPMALEGQAEGSIVCGIGMGLLEERLLDRGVTLNPSLLEYKIPTILEAPEVISEVVETIDPLGPFGAKGVSEGYQVPTAPAVLNALEAASGLRIMDLPGNPEKVWQAIHSRRKEQ
ncbi:MAG: xanthine dehydrogenase family protein molybdopterin-binding subunit [Desulfobacterales bacterium]|nr:xanthine dehydrogenase family protein molybdopterin-binding subunit [Desulfobacterales bacterium]